MLQLLLVNIPIPPRLWESYPMAIETYESETGIMWKVYYFQVYGLRLIFLTNRRSWG